MIIKACKLLQNLLIKVSLRKVKLFWKSSRWQNGKNWKRGKSEGSEFDFFLFGFLALFLSVLDFFHGFIFVLDMHFGHFDHVKFPISIFFSKKFLAFFLNCFQKFGLTLSETCDFDDNKNTSNNGHN